MRWFHEEDTGYIDPLLFPLSHRTLTLTVIRRIPLSMAQLRVKDLCDVDSFLVQSMDTVHGRFFSRLFADSGRQSFLAAMTAAVGLIVLCGPAQSAFELPEGEKITNPIVIGRGIPQKESYEPFDPKIGRNFDLRNFWIRADLGSGLNTATTSVSVAVLERLDNVMPPASSPITLAGKANDQFVQQMTRLGIGYDLSPMSIFTWSSWILVPGGEMEHL